MKKRKKLIFLLGIFIVMIIINHNKVFGEQGYTIKLYDVNVNVNENNSFNITETITTDFYENKHGIIRQIPTTNNIVRNDGSKTKNFARITDIEVNAPYRKISDSSYMSLMIGDSSKTLIGENTYIIKYKYSLYGRDKLTDADEFYYNLIGDRWDTDVENVTFKITMPKEFDKKLLGFTSGYRGSIDSSNVEYSVNGNVITGSINKKLSANQGVTVRLTLPEGYFFNIFDFLYNRFMIIVNFIKREYINITLLISLLFLIKTLIMWIKYGKDDKIIERVEFYPPKDYNSAEIGYLYNGKVTNEAVVSILIQLANEGYIKIEEINKENLLKKKTFKIRKLKEYSGNDEIEKTFFEGLFKNGEPDEKELEKKIEIERQNGKKVTGYKLTRIKRSLPIKVVTEKELKNKFYTTINKIKKKLIEHDDIVYEKNENKKEKVSSMTNKICFLSLCSIFIYSELNIFYKFAAVIILQILIPKLMNIIFFKKKSIKNIIKIVVFLLISGLMSADSIYEIAVQNEKVKLFYILILICLIGMNVLNILMSKRTKYGTEILGQIKGFKRFLETAEKNQLEALVEKNPEYFFDILPYTYALGVSKKWIKQFETIAVTPPEWFINNCDDFEKSDVIRLITNTVNEVNVSMTYGIKEEREKRSYGYSSDSSYSSYDNYSSNDNSSDYSSNSGGGSVGGGSGGGGGSSW